MADISEPFMLCRTYHRDSLLGIERHCDEDRVLLTFKDRGVLVYDLGDNKLVYSLPVQQRREFTSAVVQDPHSRKYIGILDNQYLCQWSENAEDLTDCQQIEVNQPVAQVHVNANFSTGPVVIFKDGSFNLLSNINKLKTRRTRRTSTSTSTQRFVSSSIFHHGTTQVIGVVMYKEKHLILSLTKLVTDNVTPHTREWIIETPSEDAELVDCCFQASGASLVSYWSNGWLCMTDLKDALEHLSHTVTQGQSNLTCRCIYKPQEVVTKPKKTMNKKLVAMTTVDATHICLCSETKTDKGLQKTISIFDTKFGTRQTCRSLEKLTADQDAASLTARTFSADHVLCTAGYVCVGVHHCVAVCSLSVEKSSLATALGKMAQTLPSSEKASMKPLLCVPKLPTPDQDLKDWVDSMKTIQSTEEMALDKLTNPQKTKTVEDFTAELTCYFDSKHDSKGKKECVDTVLKTPMKSKDIKLRGKVMLSQYFVLTVLSRCLEETRFWPREALSQLIKTGCIPGSSSPDLLKRLIEKNEMDMILQCFRRIQGIPESVLVLCLQYVLEADNSVFGDDVTPQDKTMESSNGLETPTDEETKIYECPFGGKKSNILCRLLSYSVNDVFIQDSIKKFSSSNIITLMKFLVHVVQTAPRSSFERNNSPLKYSTALDWAGWLVNAHYTNLVLMSDVHDLLLDLHDYVQDQVKLFDSLRHIDGFLTHYKSKQPLPIKKHIGPYTIEMLEL